jgi:prolyl-tRNA editing enzyme YbaK/EbsC (Cys-tRNA(Pro) deacylase)
VADVHQPDLHPNVARVVDAAAGRGLTVVPRRFPEGTRTAADAARAVGCDVAQIVKSLVFAVGDRLVLVLVSGAHRVDEGKLAASVGAEPGTVRRPDADEVRAGTGFNIGGVAPFGATAELPVYVDRQLLPHGEVWMAAGTATDVCAVAPDDLVRATGALVVDVAE